MCIWNHSKKNKFLNDVLRLQNLEIQRCCNRSWSLFIAELIYPCTVFILSFSVVVEKWLFQTVYSYYYFHSLIFSHVFLTSPPILVRSWTRDLSLTLTSCSTLENSPCSLHGQHSCASPGGIDVGESSLRAWKQENQKHPLLPVI